MTLTNYTKHCLENGDRLNVYILNEYMTPSQLQAMTNCCATYDEQRGAWFVSMNKDNYKAMCAALRGLKAHYFVKH